MIIFRKPRIESPTTSERVMELKKSIDTLVDELNIAIEQITREIDEIRRAQNGD